MSGGQEERDTTPYEIGDGYIDDGNKFFCLGLNVTSMPSKGFYLCDKELLQDLDHFDDKGGVQGQSGDPYTDKDWVDLQGEERWNFLIYSRSDHLVEFEGICVKLSYERTNTSTFRSD